ncbi:hypothetical protein L2E82_31183 [Cichorium intybus]|uniref:Uncharacterized protein n=1 Tax=Cichorium intybus TaxID=13427 RepID=A0ACB9D355_CICIN|nr:hypothetical protein L2E82_31183 [Cichorium intybus]
MPIISDAVSVNTRSDLRLFATFRENLSVISPSVVRKATAEVVIDHRGLSVCPENIRRDLFSKNKILIDIFNFVDYGRIGTSDLVEASEWDEFRGKTHK